ncbi:histidine phosphatase family protein [Candidatus Saccharibacteria bacterium]|nr:histidine phosphatase family protein [Candidatus Saccharibacteria bacterium]
MKRYVIRHGVSSANDKDSPAFGSPDAHLLEKGKQQARALVEPLSCINIQASVATSELLRTQETAHEAGFTNIARYAILNELTTELSLKELTATLEHKIVPHAGIHRAEEILSNPPSEIVWFTHGLVIASLCEVLGVSQDRFIPRFCEIRELDI